MECDKIKKVQNDLEEGKLIEIEQLRDKIKINKNLKEELNRQIGRKGVFDEYPDLDFAPLCPRVDVPPRPEP